MKRSLIKARSSKQAAKDSEYSDARPAALDRDNHECQFNYRWFDARMILEPGDDHPPVDHRGRLTVHHIIRRGRDNDHDLDNLVTLCNDHHEWVHAHPKLSKQAGLLVSDFTPRSKI